MNELEKKFNADLEERVEKMESVGQWVSVKERLPEEGAQVIVLLEFETEEPETICAGYDDIGFFNLEDRTHYWINVTRWMPLPEPPK